MNEIIDSLGGREKFEKSFVSFLKEREKKYMQYIESSLYKKDFKKIKNFVENDRKSNLSDAEMEEIVDRFCESVFSCHNNIEIQSEDNGFCFFTVLDGVKCGMITGQGTIFWVEKYEGEKE